jgi:hypothetical protein
MALLSALLGGVLLYLAIPRTLAAWASLEAQPAISAMQNGQRPSDSGHAEGIAGLQRALRWTTSARRLTDLALLELEQAEQLATDSLGRRRLLVSAQGHLLAGLAEDAANGFAWLRLALVRKHLQAPPREVAEALLQSVDVAPNMRKLWIPRAIMLLAYWRQLTPDEMPVLRNQLRTIWNSHETYRYQLVRDAHQTGQTLLLQWAVGDDPASLAELQRIYRAMSLK